MSAADLVAELHGVIDRLLAVDPAALDAAELQGLVVGLQRERSRLAVVAADPMHVWEQRGGWRADGTLSASLALGRDTHSDHRTARYELLRARRLQRLQHTRAAILAGRLSVDHLDLFVQYASKRRFDLFVEHEAEIVEQCGRWSLFDDCRRIVQHWTHLADDILGGRRERPAPSTLYLSRSEVSGEGVLDGRLSAVDTEIVAGELDRLTRQVTVEDKRQGVERTPAQRRAAALVRMATRSAGATGVAPRPLFQVIIGDQTATRLCQLASGAVVHPDDLAAHLDTAVVESCLFDGPSTVIAKSQQRTFTGALRKAIQVRDRRCQHASGCPVPAVDCDVDHKRPAVRGGPTSQFNGRAGCRAHNRFPELRDDPTEDPDRDLTDMDILRTLIRWRMHQHHPDEVGCGD